MYRFGEFETNARVFSAGERDGRIDDVILLDGSHARVSGEKGPAFDAPHRMPHVYLTGT